MNAIQMIPVTAIRVLNPRSRNKVKFGEIIANISRVGLKKPITVSPRTDGEPGYDLVCGQGRLEAYVALEQSEVPAVVVDVPREDRFIMSLVENIARRQPKALDLAREVKALQDRGHNMTEIARKLDVSVEYISMFMRLLNKGEERLLVAVEKGVIPVNVAIDIAGADDEVTQRRLMEAYESGKLRGHALTKVRQLIGKRKLRGKGLRGEKTERRRAAKELTTDNLVRAYKKEVQKQAMLVKKARLCETRLTFIQTALRDLFADENFVNLLRAEGLHTLPKYVRDRIRAGGT